MKNFNFKIPNNKFSQNVYLKSRVDWPRVSEDLCNFNWSAVYNSLISVSELNKVITSLIDRRVPTKIIRRKVNNKACLTNIALMYFTINKMHILSGHRIDHPFCGKNI